MTLSNKALRRAAILVSTLDADSADALLDQMPGEEAMQIRNALMDLDHIDPTEEARVLQEFVSRKAKGAAPAHDSGVELDVSLAGKISQGYSDHQSTPHNTVAGGVAPSSNSQYQVESPPFRFLRRTDGDLLFQFLRFEHAQTIAVVVSYLTPEVAADFVARLQPDQQVAVLKRVTEIDSIDMDSVREIERQLKDLVDDQIRLESQRSAGLSAVKSILEAAEGGDRRNMLTNLARSDQDLAFQVADADDRRPRESFAPQSSVSRRRMAADSSRPSLHSQASVSSTHSERVESTNGGELRHPEPETEIEHPDEWGQDPVDTPELPRVEMTYEEVLALDDEALLLVLKAAPPMVTQVVLAAADETLMRRVASKLSKRDAAALRKQVTKLGAISLRDVDRAQEQLCVIASKLLQEEKIQKAERKSFAMAV